jgi:hypothetical protein
MCHTEIRRGIKKVRAVYYFLYSTYGTQEQIYCDFSMLSPSLLLQSMSILMPSAKNVFGFL